MTAHIGSYCGGAGRLEAANCIKAMSRAAPGIGQQIGQKSGAGIIATQAVPQDCYFVSSFFSSKYSARTAETSGYKPTVFAYYL